MTNQLSPTPRIFLQWQFLAFRVIRTPQGLQMLPFPEVQQFFLIVDWEMPACLEKEGSYRLQTFIL